MAELPLSLIFIRPRFLPPYLVATGHPELVTVALTAYNIVQVAGSLLVLLFAKRLERRRWPYLTAGAGLLICLAWIASSTGEQTVTAATVLGLVGRVTLATGHPRFAFVALGICVLPLIVFTPSLDFSRGRTDDSKAASG